MTLHVFEAAIISVVCMLATGTITYFITRFKKTVNHLRDKDSAIEKGVKALLRDRIYQACLHFEAIGYVPFFELENIQNMFMEYKNLGGNGIVMNLFEKVKKLPEKNPNSECK